MKFVSIGFSKKSLKIVSILFGIIAVLLIILYFFSGKSLEGFAVPTPTTTPTTTAATPTARPSTTPPTTLAENSVKQKHIKQSPSPSPLPTTLAASSITLPTTVTPSTTPPTTLAGATSPAASFPTLDNSSTSYEEYDISQVPPEVSPTPANLQTETEDINIYM